ncbi:MAG: peptidylprolyl isomerase [Alistipes sp.]|nr:peptidylprolyl isomerase [Alistipes sp.]
MKKIISILSIVLIFGVMFMSCRSKSSTGSYNSDSDTISYVVGMNIAHALMEMDSTLNIEVVCDAIKDVYNEDAYMTLEEARDYYLAEKVYFVHERAKAHQEQYLADLNKRDRSYVRTRTGVTYKIIKLGDQSHVGGMSTRDTVKIVYTITDESGREIIKSDTLRDSYRKLVKGLQEVVKLAGEGSHFNAWLPSSVAYDTDGNKALGIGPNVLLNYDVKVLDIKYSR